MKDWLSRWLRWRGLWAVGGAAVSGLLWSFAGPSFGLWPLGLVALVPWMVTAWRLDTGGVWMGVLSAYCFGFVASLVTDHTLARALRFYFDLPWRVTLPAFAAAVCAQALFYLPMGAALGGLKRLGAPLLPAFVAAALGSEWLLPRVDRVAYGSVLIDAPLLPQLAELGGTGLLSLCVLTLNGALASAWLAPRPQRRAWLSGTAAAAMLLAGLGAWLQQRALVRAAGAPRQTLAALQPAGALFCSEEEKARQRDWLARRTAALAARGVPLVLWPESSLRTSVPANMEDASEWVPEGVTVWFGAAARWPDERTVYRNSVFAVGPDGRVVGRYDKRGLLPFAEYVPAWAPFMQGILDGRIDPGDGSSSLSFAGHRVGVSICYEDMLGPELRRRAAAEPPELLLNFTNDRWFDSERAQRRHLRLARLRAVEAGRYLIRATTTGISAVVDPTGRVVAEAPPSEPAELVVQAPWLTHRTPYVAFGEWAYASCALWLLVAILRARRLSQLGHPAAPEAQA